MGNALLFPNTPCTYTVSELEGVVWCPVVCGYASTPSGVDLDKLGRDPGCCFPVQYFPAKSPAGGKHVLLYFHGNSCDMGEMASEMVSLNDFCECHIFSFEYPGYGICSSKKGFSCSPDTINLWGKALAFFLIAAGLESSALIPFGRSIGTGPAAQLSKLLCDIGYPPGGLVLHSPYVSIHRIVQDYATTLGTFLINNHWDTKNNLAVLAASQIPLLIIHGLNDEVISVAHGQELFNSYSVSKDLKEGTFPEDSEHNSYYVLDDLAIPIRRFTRNKCVSRVGSPQTVRLPTWSFQVPYFYSKDESLAPNEIPLEPAPSLLTRKLSIEDVRTEKGPWERKGHPTRQQSPSEPSTPTQVHVNTSFWSTVFCGCMNSS